MASRKQGNALCLSPQGRWIKYLPTRERKLTDYRPGEKLPKFPEPTHGPGKIPYPTVSSTISNIPAHAPDHDIQRAYFQNPKPPFDPYSFAKTVTCGGGENYHPSGLRRYTNREFACLQTFPLDFKFHNNVKKQIGNAVPPRLSQTIYEAIIKSLHETDEQELEEERARRQNPVTVD